MISTVIPTYSGIFLIPIYSYLIDVYVCVWFLCRMFLFSKVGTLNSSFTEQALRLICAFVLSVHLTDLLTGTSYWLIRKHVIKQIPWEFKHEVRPFCLSNQLALIVRISIVSIPHDHVMSTSSIALDVYCTLNSVDSLVAYQVLKCQRILPPYGLEQRRYQLMPFIS